MQDPLFETMLRYSEELPHEEEEEDEDEDEDEDENDASNIFADTDGPLHKKGETTSGGSTREILLTSLLPVSTWEEMVDGDSNNATVVKFRRPQAFRVYLEAAAYLAIDDFNARRNRVLPNLSELLQDCDLRIKLSLRDTQFSPIQAGRQLQDALALVDKTSRCTEAEDQAAFCTENSSNQQPFALLGAARSAVSQTVSVLASVYELPQVSSSSTSASLDNKESSPYFARTVPSNAGDAKALVQYLTKLLGVSHVGVIYVRDSFGENFHSAILKEASQLQESTGTALEVVSAAYDDDESSIEMAVRRIEQSRLRYVFAILNGRTWKTVVREAIRSGIIGSPGYTWLLSEAQQSLTQGGKLDADTELDLAQALHGSGVVILDIGNESTERLDDHLRAFENSTDLQDQLIHLHEEESLRDGLRNWFDWVYPGIANYIELTYDAALALGVAGCNTPSNMFNGPQIYESLLQTEFEGVTGYVSFDSETGTRKAEDLRFRVENIRLEDQIAGSHLFLSSTTVVRLNLRSEDSIEIVKPFVYFDNSTTPPLALPKFESELNLIPRPLIILGLCLGGITIVASMGWMVWTWFYRNSDVVRMSQPIFLCQLALGCIIMATTIIPMSLQEPVSENILDNGCMAAPWLMSFGFVIAFSALFSKAWRLNRLFKSGNGFRRVQVRAQDVLWPFMLLLLLNSAILIFWTVFDPLRYTRISIAEGVDQYGRATESYAVCGSEGAVGVIVLPTLIIVVNAIALLFTNYQCYLTRTLPTEFNESFYVALTNASLLEAGILGGPILLVVRDSPSARFVVNAILITIICWCILLPVFIPKYLQRNNHAKRRRQGKTRPRIALSGYEQTNSYAQGLAMGDSSRSSDLNKELSSKRSRGKSTIVRNDDYYFQRSTDSLRDSSSRLRNLVNSLPSLTSRNKEGPHLPEQNSLSRLKTISKTDIQKAVADMHLDDSQESDFDIGVLKMA